MTRVIFFTFILFIVVACERPTPEQLRERQHLPEPGFKANVSQGKHLFDAKCARCHGIAGKGTEQGPPLVHATYRPSHHSDITFHWAIKDGVQQHHWHFGNMPPQPEVSPEQAGHIIAYIRSKQRESGIK